MAKPSGYASAVDVFNNSILIVENPNTGVVERTTPQRVSRSGISPLNDHLDCGGFYLYNTQNKKTTISGAHTFSTLDGNVTHVYTGAGSTWTVPALREIGGQTRTEAQVVHNRGTGAITLSPSGVTIKGQTSIPVDASATLEWEASATTAYCWVRVAA
jgi:hypothetical protein